MCIHSCGHGKSKLVYVSSYGHVCVCKIDSVRLVIWTCVCVRQLHSVCLVIWTCVCVRQIHSVRLSYEVCVCVRQIVYIISSYGYLCVCKTEIVCVLSCISRKAAKIMTSLNKFHSLQFLYSL